MDGDESHMSTSLSFASSSQISNTRSDPNMPQVTSVPNITKRHKVPSPSLLHVAAQRICTIPEHWPQVINADFITYLMLTMPLTPQKAPIQ